jgi:hypothetical protein
VSSTAFFDGVNPRRTTLSAQTNRRYGRALLDTLTAYAGRADRKEWYAMTSEYKEPGLAVIHSAAYFMAWRIRSWNGYAHFKVRSAVVWSNLDEDDCFLALAHVVDLPKREDLRAVYCRWQPADENGNATDFQRAAGGTVLLLDRPGRLEQDKTVVARKDGNWASWYCALDKAEARDYAPAMCSAGTATRRWVCRLHDRRL